MIVRRSRHGDDESAGELVAKGLTSSEAEAYENIEDDEWCYWAIPEDPAKAIIHVLSELEQASSCAYEVTEDTITEFATMFETTPQAVKDTLQGLLNDGELTVDDLGNGVKVFVVRAH